MKYNFDTVIERHNTNSLKWDHCKELHGENVLPMWVADMDFKAPEEVIEAIKRRSEHGVFGYTPVYESYYDSVIGWMKNRHDWIIKKDWIIPAPGVLPALGMTVLAYTKPGDKIVIQTPVYHPFNKIIRENGRLPIENSLKKVNGEYQMDYENLEKLGDQGAGVLILCSPHNPVGRVWKRGELEKLSEICINKNILVISDEIHSDLIMKGYRHTPMACAGDNIAERTITFTSASKTFNLAGLACANVIISNKELYDRFNNISRNLCVSTPNIFGMVATEAAYGYGEEWLNQLLDYIIKNFEFLKSFLEDYLPIVKVNPLEGTYLGWLNFQELGLSDGDLNEMLLKNARVWLDEGPKFGKGGEGYQRINLACPKAVLKEGLQRIEKAVNSFL